MTTIYVVTTGEYSDYGICAMFSSKEKADQYCERFKKHADYTGYDIEEYTLDPIPDDVYRENKELYHVQMWKDGTVRQTYTTHLSSHNVQLSFAEYGRMERKDDPVVLCMEVWSKSEEHAIKIVNEKRRQLIAENKWGKEIE